MLTGPRGLFLIAGQEKVVTVDLERVLTAPPVEHLTVHSPPRLHSRVLRIRQGPHSPQARALGALAPEARGCRLPHARLGRGARGVHEDSLGV